MTDIKKIVDMLLDKAAASQDGGEALRFSQAALNAAHTKHALTDIPLPKD